MFLEPKRLYNGPFDGHHERPVTAWSKHELGDVPDGHYAIPIGKAEIRRKGSGVTVIAYGTMVHVAVAAAEETGYRRGSDRSAQSVAARSRTIVQSAKKTGRCVVVHEATLTSGFGAELAALVQEHCFYHLEVSGRTGNGLGHALSARAGVGLFPRSGTRRACARRSDGGLTGWVNSSSRCRTSARVSRRPSSSSGCEARRSGARGYGARRVMTDKATVEIPSPVTGKVLWLGAEVATRSR